MRVPVRREMGTSQTQCFLSSLPSGGVSGLKKPEFSPYNPDCLPAPFVRWRWLFLTSDKMSFIPPTRMLMAAEGWLPGGGQCGCGRLGGCRCQAGLNEWGEERSPPLSFCLLLPFPSLPHSLLPSPPWLFSLPCYFFSRSTVTWTCQEMGEGAKPWLKTWVRYIETWVRYIERQ